MKRDKTIAEGYLVSVLLPEPLDASFAKYLQTRAFDDLRFLLEAAESVEGNVLTDAFYTLVLTEPVCSTVLRHLCDVLVYEERQIEAEWAVERWLKYNPMDKRLLRSATFLAIMNGRVERAANLIRTNNNADDSTKLTLRGAFALRFGQERLAKGVAPLLLTTHPRDELALAVALQIGIRLEDPHYVTAVLNELVASGGTMELGGHQERHVRDLVRRSFLVCLHDRVQQCTTTS
jgi:hypothetical protein